MPSQNFEKLKREFLISEILDNQSSKALPIKPEHSLFVDPNGVVKNINSETSEFLKFHFNIALKKENSLFEIIPMEFLEDFLKQFKETVAGYSTSILIKSSFPNKDLQFRLILVESDENSLIEIRITTSDAINYLTTASLSKESIQEVEILNKTSQVFESLFNNHPDAVYSFDLQGNFISANESACKMAEISNSELLKHSFLPLIPEKDQEMVLNHFLKAVKGEFQNYNTGMRSFKGNEIIINITNFPITINGEVTGVFGIAKDITEAELIKKRSEDLEHRYKNILDQSLDVICTIDKNGLFVEINEASFNTWGYKPEELIGKNFMDIVFIEDRERTKNSANDIREGEDETNFFNRYVRKDGSIVPMVWSSRWVEDEQIYYSIAKNASELNAVKTKLEEDRNILRAIIDNIPDYVFVKNRQDELILANKKFYSDYLGKESEAELLGLRPTEYLPTELGKEIIKDNRLVMEDGLAVSNRMDIVYDYLGNKEVILLTKVPFKTKEGDVIGLVGIARNITENYEFEQEQKLISKLIESLSASKNLKEGLSDTIKTISEYFDFDFAQAWEVGMIDGNLRELTVYKKQEETSINPEVIDAISTKILPTTLFDVKQTEISLDADSDGILIGLPIIFDKKVIQILTFYGTKLDREVSVLKEILNRLSLQISSDIQRKITESQLNNLFKFSPNLIAVIGLDGYLKKVSPSFIRIFGYSEDELLNTPFYKFLHPEEVDVSFKRLKEVTQGYLPKSYEGRCRTKDGEWKWISWIPSEIISDDGIINLFGLDITPLKTANLEMLKFKKTIENSSEGVAIIDLKSEEVYLNNSLRKALGYSEEEINQIKKIKKIYSKKIQGEEVYNQLLNGESWNGDIQLLNKSNEVLDYQFSGGPIFNQNEELIAVYGIHTDITERKNYAKELKVYNDQIIDILESITDGFFSFTKDSKVTYFNKEAERLLNIPRETIIGNYFWEFFPESKKSLSYKKYKEAIRTGKKVSFLEYLKEMDKWFEINAYPSANGLSVYFKDITLRKMADEEIRNAKERYELVAKVTHEAIYDWDIPNNTMEWSNAYYTTYGYKIPELDNGLEHWENQLHPEVKDEVILSLEKALEDHSVNYWEYVYRLVKADKEISIVMDRGLIKRNKDGKPIRMIGSLQDITQLKQNEIVLEQLNTKLEFRANELATSNAELEQFAYIASHDLQEPLRMVTSFLTQLNKKYKDQLDPKAQQYIYYATDGAVRMRQILLDLLEYSRVGRMDYQLKEIDLNKLVKEISILHRDLILESKGEIIFNDLPKIHAAPIPIQRVLSNLITNALKYQTPENNAKIKIEAFDKVDFWQIDVIDNGIGIEEQFFEKIFVVFQRLHSKDKYSGTGIGLSICRKIIENHGGKIWVSSKINKGSTFHLTIKKQN